MAKINRMSKTPFKTSLVIFVSLFLFAGALFLMLRPATEVDAAPIPGGGIGTIGGGSTGGGSGGGQPSTLLPGTVTGFAWMGQNISQGNTPEGGGGWLAMNCLPNDCVDFNGNGSIDASEKWGTTIDLDHQGTDGLFQGQAWSSNYGWLSFDEDNVSQCWQNNPYVTTQTPATAMINDPGPEVPVVGWGRFINGMDDPNDGYDGCVSFSGANHGVQLNLNTGALLGWAWGGPVVGWISFVTPECPYCNTSVVLENTANLQFWASPSAVPPGGVSTLHWTSTGSGGNYVAKCPAYSNTNNYNHWRTNSVTTANVGEISVSAGNLPNGQHPVAGIGSETTYEIHCEDVLHNALPVQYATVGILGCTDPNAENYEDKATVDDGSCVYNGGPAVNLSLVTNYPPSTLPVGSTNSFDYQVSPRWTFTNPQQVGPQYCSGQFYNQNGVEQTLAAWTGADLNRPSAPSWSPGPYSGTDNVATFAPGVVAGQYFTYKINCTDIDGNTFSDTAQVVFADIPCDDCEEEPPGGGSVTLSLSVDPQYMFVGSGDYAVDGVSWTSNSPSDLSACVGSITKTISGTTSTISSLTNWTQNLPSPNNNNWIVAHPINLGPVGASTANANDVFTFKITCNQSGGGTLSATDTVVMTPQIVSSEPPSVQLLIIDPDTQPVGYSREDIPATGLTVPMTLKMNVLNADSCVASSQMFTVGGVSDGPNSQWNGSISDNELTPPATRNITNLTDPAFIKRTRFTLSCVPTNTGVYGTSPISSTVCMGIQNQEFPECGVSVDTQIPSYQEI